MRVFITSNGCNVAEAMRPADVAPDEGGWIPTAFIIFIVGSLILFFPSSSSSRLMTTMRVMLVTSFSSGREEGERDGGGKNVTRDDVFFQTPKKQTGELY